jgi:hypothetical protein
MKVGPPRVKTSDAILVQFFLSFSIRKIKKKIEKSIDRERERERELFLFLTNTNIKSRGEKFTNVWTRQSDDGVTLRVRLAGEAV